MSLVMLPSVELRRWIIVDHKFWEELFACFRLIGHGPKKNEAVKGERTDAYGLLPSNGKGNEQIHRQQSHLVRLKIWKEHSKVIS